MREDERTGMDVGGPDYPKEEGGCFIATAAYNSPIDPEIDVLRRFRDKELLEDKLGKVLVKAYYAFGPYFARIISYSNKLRVAIRTLLSPIVEHFKRKYE